MQQIAKMIGLVGVVALSLACSGDQKKDDKEMMPEIRQVTTETRNEQGQIVRGYDANGDGKPNVIRYLEEVADPDDPTQTIRKLRKMEIDVNFDGRINIVRNYDDAGRLRTEESDLNLDGTLDIISHYDRGSLAKKEILEPGTKRVVATRYYAGGNVLRVEKDTTGDNLIDYWEYYEQGVLDRIGRDFNADERADTWQKR